MTKRKAAMAVVLVVEDDRTTMHVIAREPAYLFVQRRN